ncbi:MAG: hypothetical protein JWL61_3246 [Gemmatimonadetes bacterium]|nr:hypothetical protein [Gemmatimonadota bacterium]
MNMYRKYLLLIAALALTAPAPSRAQSSSAERTEREREAKERAAERERERAERDRERQREREERDKAGALDTVVVFDARGSVSVSCPGGAVIVTGADRNEIRVRARTDNGAIRFTSNGMRATLEPASGRGCSDGHFEMTVPVGTKVVATSWSGSVSVKGVHGDVEAHAQSGDIQIRDAGARLDVEALSGDVVVAGVKGDTRINTVSGSVDLSGGRGDLEIESVSGDIELRDVVAKQVRTHTTSGDVSFAGQIIDGGRYEFNTHSGEIVLSLPGDIGAQLSVSTFNGGIESDFPITLTPGVHGIGTSQAKRLNFTVGRGTARIAAETFSGDITLKRRR